MPHELLPLSMVQNKKRHAEHMGRLRSKRELRKRVNGPFDFPVSSVGKTQDGRVEVWYDPALGNGGLALAQVLLSQIQMVMIANDNFFQVTGLAGNLLLVPLSGQSDGSGGAYHYGCSFGTGTSGGADWYIDYATFTNGMDLGLSQAEVCESYMGLQNKGWDCGGSNGEGSRACWPSSSAAVQRVPWLISRRFAPGSKLAAPTGSIRRRPLTKTLSARAALWGISTGCNPWDSPGGRSFRLAALTAAWPATTRPSLERRGAGRPS